MSSISLWKTEHTRMSSAAMGMLVNSKIKCLHKNKNSTMLMMMLPLQRQKGCFCLLKSTMRCGTSLEQQHEEVVEEEEDDDESNSRVECEACSGIGWLVCDFCNGQKTNVTAVNNRIYRRCPSYSNCC